MNTALQTVVTLLCAQIEPYDIVLLCIWGDLTLR